MLELGVAAPGLDCVAPGVPAAACALRVFALVVVAGIFAVGWVPGAMFAVG